MKKTAGIIAAVILTAAFVTGCGTDYVKEGTGYLEKENYKKAETAFQQAAEEDKEDPEAWRGLGIAKWEQKDYKGALEAFRSVLENGGEQTGELYNLMGSCALKLDEPKQALNYYRLGISSEDVSDELMQEMRRNEIVAYEKTGDAESAKKKLESYMSDYPDDKAAAKEEKFLETR